MGNTRVGTTWVIVKANLSGGCHSHRLYSHSCDPTQSMVNGQSRVKKTANVQIPVRNGPDYSAVIHSEPVGGVRHAQSAYFLTYRLADLDFSSNIETSLQAKYLSSQRSMAKN